LFLSRRPRAAFLAIALGVPASGYLAMHIDDFGDIIKGLLWVTNSNWRYIQSLTDQNRGQSPTSGSSVTGITLASFTPSAPVLGNGLAVVGGATGSSAAPALGILMRQPDCGLNQLLLHVPAGSPTVTTLPDVGAYLHALSGLETTPGVFPEGCRDDDLGVPAGPAVSLGRAPNGDYLGAYVSPSGNLRFGQVGLGGERTSVSTLASKVDFGATLSAADFNHDGFVDLVVANLAADGQAGVGVFLGKSDGSLNSPTIYPPVIPGETGLATTVEDLDGDGDLDIVVLTGPAGTVASLLGDGKGGFAFGPVPVDALGIGPLVRADFNSDGRKDVLTAGGELLLGQGDGTLSAATFPFADLGFDGFGFNGFGSLVAGDFNRDGRQDIAATRLGILSIFPGNGDGTFADGADYGQIKGGRNLGVTDIDGDGNADIVVGGVGPGLYGPDMDTQTVIQFLMGRGDGRFIGAPALASKSYQEGFGVADFDGDGRADLVRAGLPAGTPVGGGQLELRILPGTAAGGFGTALAATPTDFYWATQVAAGDVNGDGKLDAIVAGKVNSPEGLMSQVAVFLRNGAGGFTPKPGLVLPNEPSIVMGDFNGDGRADLALSLPDTTAPSGDTHTAVYFGNSDGTLTPSALNEVSKAGLLAAGDLNGDGRADLLLAKKGGTATDTIAVRLGQGDGSFLAAPAASAVAGINTLAVADIDRDGKADLVAGAEGSGNAGVYVWPGTGDGGFLAPIPNMLPNGAGDFVRAMTTGDFNRDGHPDVLVSRNYFSQYLFGKGDGSFPSSVGLTLASRASSLVTADVNGDGHSDAVAELEFYAGLVSLINQPSPVAAPAPTPEPIPAPGPTPSPIPPLPTGPYVRIVFPNGGENLRAGTKYPIQWTSGNLGKPRKLDLYFLKSGAAAPKLLKKGLKSQGVFQWKPRNKNSTARGFIKVCARKAKKSPAVCDTSDGGFSIVRK
jgi:hypothetical protein